MLVDREEVLEYRNGFSFFLVDWIFEIYVGTREEDREDGLFGEFF